MISEKMTAIGKSPSKIREIFEYSKKRKAEIGEDKVFDFSLGNPNIPAPEKVNETIIDLIKNTESTELHGYTSAVGDFKTRSVIAENIGKRFGFSCSPDNLYMTCGAAASLEITLKALCNEGDEVIALCPYFPEYKVFIENAGAKTVEVACREGDLGIDIDNIKASLTGKTKAVIINSPNNPSGVVFKKEDIEALANLLEEHGKKTGSAVYIICDEPYREIVYGDIEVPYIPAIYDNTVVCYSYSKSFIIFF